MARAVKPAKKIRKKSVPKAPRTTERDNEIPLEVTTVEEGEFLNDLYSLFNVSEETDIEAVMSGRVDSDEW